MSSTTFVLLAEGVNEEIRSGYGGMIFMGIFILAAMVAGMWWLQR